jgi:transcriptional regulatory protein LevR
VCPTLVKIKFLIHMNQMLEKLMGKQAHDTFNEPFQPNESLKAVKTLKNG